MSAVDLKSKCKLAAQACAIAIGFSVAISVWLDNVLLILTLLLWLASAQWHGKLHSIANNRVALAAFGLFSLLVIGLAYGEHSFAAGLNELGKYADLAFVPIFVTLFDSERARRNGLRAFAAAVALTLVLSYLTWAGLIPSNRLFAGTPADPSIFKKYLTQNFFLAFGAFVFWYLARTSDSRKWRCIFYGMATLTAINIMLLGHGRTGQLVLAALAIYVGYCVWQWRGLLATAAATAIVFALLSTHMGAAGDRFSQGLTELHQWQPQQASDTSIGLRMEFLRNGIQIARQHPFMGGGTGSFSQAYANQVAGSAMVASDNPHDEYINIAVQLGAVGLLALSYLFYCSWRNASRLSPRDGELARALILTFVIGCCFNSLLMDHAEGLLFSWALGVLFAGLKPLQLTKAPR